MAKQKRLLAEVKPSKEALAAALRGMGDLRRSRRGEMTEQERELYGLASTARMVSEKLSREQVELKAELQMWEVGAVKARLTQKPDSLIVARQLDIAERLRQIEQLLAACEKIDALSDICPECRGTGRQHIPPPEGFIGPGDEFPCCACGYTGRRVKPK